MAGTKETKGRRGRPKGKGKPTGQIRSPIIADNNPPLPAGYNTKRIQFMMAIMPTEPIDIHDVPEMERRFMRYLQMCAEWDMKVGNLAAYAAIGISKEQVYEWTTNSLGDKARTEFCRKVQKVCAMYREGLMEDSKINPVTGIFWQKNFDGFRDQQEVVVSPNANPLGEAPDTAKLEQKYIDATYGISGEIAEKEVAKIEMSESKTRGRKKSQKGAES